MRSSSKITQRRTVHIIKMLPFNEISLWVNLLQAVMLLELTTRRLNLFIYEEIETVL